MENDRSSTKHHLPVDRVHLVIGKLYSDGCIYCRMMEKDWEKMKLKLAKDMRVKMESDDHAFLKHYQRYVSKDGKTVVEVIEIESEQMDAELPYVNNTYLGENDRLDLQGGFPTLFKIQDNHVSYYNGERTSHKMGEWATDKTQKAIRGGKTRRKRNLQKTKKNKTRTRYSHTRSNR